MQVFDDFIFFFFIPTAIGRKPRIAKLYKDFHNAEKEKKKKSKSAFIKILSLNCIKRKV